MKTSPVVVMTTFGCFTIPAGVFEMSLVLQKTYKLQGDTRMRVVMLTNLEAMCNHVSDETHRFWVEKVTRSRVWVGYKNSDATGTENIFAILPCYPNPIEPENMNVVLDVLRFLNLKDERTEFFNALLNAPKLVRSAPHSSDWSVNNNNNRKRR